MSILDYCSTVWG